MANMVLNPIAFFTDLTGKPLQGGHVYIGVANTNPVTNPLTVYQDAAMTIPMAQPLSVTNGYVTLNGTPQPVFVNAASYSLAVNDSAGNLTLSLPNYTNLLLNQTGAGGASQIGFDGTTLDQQFLNRVARVVDSIAALRALSKSTYTRAYVNGYYAAGDGGGGAYYYDPLDTSSTDNGGTIIVATDGGRWKLSSTTVVSLRQFGAKGDGATDDTTAIQNALTWAASGGKLLRAPAGLYVISAGITATLNNGTPINSGGLRLTMIGDGPGSTCFQYAGAASPTLFTFTGAYADRLLLEGFRVQHTDQASVSSNGIGIALNGQVNTVLRDVHAFRMTTGLSATDINSCEFDNCYFGYNKTGFVTQFGTVTYPNALSFRNCYFQSNYQNGCVIQNGVTVTFDTCTFEANGMDNSGNVQTGGTGLAFSNNGVNGTASLIVRGCYFEHNAGAADVYVTHTATGTYIFEGNTFNRIDSVQFVTNNIVLDASALGSASAPCKVKLVGNGYFRAGSYVANSARRYINFAHGSSGYNQFYIHDDGNNYMDVSELPIFSGTLDSRYGEFAQMQAQAYVTGATGVMSSNSGVFTLTRASAGVYNIVLVRNVGTPMVNVIPGTGSMSYWISNVAGNSFTLNFANSSGTPTDPLFFIFNVFNGA